MREVPVSYLRECLSYDAETGDFTWLVRPRRHFQSKRSWNGTNTKCAGKKAGHIDKLNGYLVIGLSFNGVWQLLQGHRVAVAMADGKWPELPVDHKNRRKANNRRRNLRVCTHEQNMRNQGKKSSGKNPLKGAYFHSRRGKWHSSICVNYKQIYLGYFDTAEAAHAAYRSAAKIHHGAFANFG